MDGYPKLFQRVKSAPVELSHQTLLHQRAPPTGDLAFIDARTRPSLLPLAAAAPKTGSFRQPARAVFLRVSRSSPHRTSGSSAVQTDSSNAGRQKFTNFFHRLEAKIVIHAGKGFADIESVAAPVEFLWSSFGKLESRPSLPVSRPLASGTRARMPTCLCFAWAKKTSAGRWRKQLKIICTVCTLGY